MNDLEKNTPEQELSPEEAAVKQLTTTVEKLFDDVAPDDDPRFGLSNLPEGFDGTPITLHAPFKFPSSEDDARFFITKGIPFDESQPVYALSVLAEHRGSDEYTWTEGDDALVYTHTNEYAEAKPDFPGHTYTPVTDLEKITALTEMVEKAFREPEAETEPLPKGRIRRLLAQRALKQDQRELDRHTAAVKAGRDPRTKFDRVIDKLLGE